MIYHCKECLQIYESKLSRCTNPDCRAWNSIIAGEPNIEGEIVDLDEIDTNEVEKLPSEDKRLVEWDECLDGGTVPGLSYLLGGEPGIGKSTLSLQWLASMSFYGSTLYISAEEAGRHVAVRKNRILKNSKICFLEERQIEKIIEKIEGFEPAFCVLDSIQVLSKTELRTGSIQCQVECLNDIIQSIKSLNTTLVIISHVNKDGDIAGPKTLEHLVDCVLQFDGDRNKSLRTIRALKNRFGQQKMGIFEMQDSGLISVSGEDMLNIWTDNIPGRVATIAIEDTRPIAIEIQALLGAKTPGTPRRYSQGYSLNRLNMILAVLEKNGIIFSNREVYINVVGGLTLSDTGIDVGVARALVDASLDRESSSSVVWSGELGLLGDTVKPSHFDARKRIAEKMKLKFIYPDNIKSIINN